MSSFDGYSDEMGRHPTDEEIEAILTGRLPEGIGAAGLAGALEQLRSLADVPVPDELVARHVSMVVAEVSLSPATGPSTSPVAASKQPRRRLVLSGFLSTLLGKVMAASVAFAAAGSGVAVMADGAAPGDALYGIDRALERVGILDGGAAERVAEAQALMERDLPDQAVAQAAEAAEIAGDGNTAAALTEAAARVRSAEGEVSSLTRQQVAAILELLAAQIADGGVVGEDVAAAANSLVDTVQLPEQATGGEGGAPDEAPVPDLPEEAGSGEDAPTPPATTPDTTLPDEAGSGGSYRP